MLHNLFSSFSCQTVCLGNNLVNIADHVESNLGQVIVLASQDLLESRDGLGDGDKFARIAGENFSDLKKKKKT